MTNVTAIAATTTNAIAATTPITVMVSSRAPSVRDQRGG
jgi:hypothetical protein